MSVTATGPSGLIGKLSIADGLPFLVAFSIPFPFRFTSIIILASLAIYMVLFIRDGRKWKDIFRTPVFLLVSAHVIILLFGLLRTQDLNEGLADMERYGLAFACVLLVSMMMSFGARLAACVAGLAAGCIVLTLYGFGHALFTLGPADRSEMFLRGHEYYTRHISIHPVYLSMYMTFVFFVTLEYIRQSYRTMRIGLKVGAFGLLLYFLFMIIFLRSQMEMLIFSLLAVLYVLMTMRRRAALVGFALVTAGFLVYLLDSQRVTTLFDTYGQDVSTALQNRQQVWRGAMHAISESPWIGNGTGGEQMALNRAYEKEGYAEGVEKAYNAHNQYLQFMISNGLVELVCFACLLFYCFYISMRQVNRGFLIFTMMFSLIMFAESSLTVQKGIVFFYFFLSAFIFLKEGDEASQTPSEDPGRIQ